MEYIDYDTREITFNEDVPKAYQVIQYSGSGLIHLLFTTISLGYVCSYELQKDS
jgi:hypothetical protein